MKELIIVGAGGFGREVLQWVKDSNRKNRRWVIKGFLSESPCDLDGYICDFNILSSVRDWTPAANQEFLIAIGSPSLKEKVVNEMHDKGAIFTTLIHPTAQVSEFVEIGEGTIICPNAEVSPNVSIGKYCTILNAGIGHDVVIGDYSTISGGCFINGNVKIGKRVMAGSGVLIVPGRVIGDDVTLGIGSVIIRNVAAGVAMFGNPAKKIN